METSTWRKVRNILGALVIVIGVVGGIYVGAWAMFIQPIIEACQCFDAGTLTGAVIAVTVLKCIFSGAVGGIIAWIGIALGYLILPH